MNTFIFIVKHFFYALGNLLPMLPVFNKIRSKFFKLAGMSIGNDCVIGGAISVRIDAIHNINIGSNTYLNSEVRFGLQDSKIFIGNNCLIGPRVCFETASHNTVYDEINGRGFFTKEIIVEDNVWIGTGAIILQGVTISKGAVVAAGAVVHRDVPCNTVVGGIPAKLLKRL